MAAQLSTHRLTHDRRAPAAAGGLFPTILSVRKLLSCLSVSQIFPKPGPGASYLLYLFSAEIFRQATTFGGKSFLEHAELSVQQKKTNIDLFLLSASATCFNLPLTRHLEGYCSRSHCFLLRAAMKRKGLQLETLRLILSAIIIPTPTRLELTRHPLYHWIHVFKFNEA